MTKGCTSQRAHAGLLAHEHSDGRSAAGPDPGASTCIGGLAGAPGAAPGAVPPVPPPKREGTLAVVGDVMLARGVGTAIARHGVEYPFAAVAGRLRAADYTFANFEFPLGVKGKPIPGKGIWFRAPPESVGGLLHAGMSWTRNGR